MINLTEQVHQLNERVVELDSKIGEATETVADLKVKLKAAETRAEDVAYEREILQAGLQQSH